MNINHLNALKAIVGESFVKSSWGGDSAEVMAKWETDYRGRERGRALAVVFPSSAEEVAKVVRWCAAQKIPMVPQGGNTGLVLGSIPTADGDEVVINLSRLNRIRTLDRENFTMIVEAGCVLYTIQARAQAEGLYFPLSMASEGSCTLGGNLATNAGGTAVLVFGNARDVCLGVEWVNAQGELVSGLRALRKDNTGINLGQILIGTEGTLGIITAATLKLFPAPKTRISAWLSLEDLSAVCAFFGRMKHHCGWGLTTFEMMNDMSVSLVRQHYPHFSSTFCSAPNPTHFHVLLEYQSQDTEAASRHHLEQALMEAIDKAEVRHAVLAQSEREAHAMWQVRESIPEAQVREGKNIKHDISLPLSSMAKFVTECEGAIAEIFQGARIVNFGHIGDGNLHFNVQAPLGLSSAENEDFVSHFEEPINALVYESVLAHGGSISAEHGIGRLKRDWLLRQRTNAEMVAMKAIKSALDPDNVFNRGRVF